MVAAAAADRPSSRSAPPHHSSDDTSANNGSRALVFVLDCLPALPVLLLGLFLACSLALTPPRRRQVHGGDLAFVAFAYTDLAALFWCARRAERLAAAQSSPSSTDGTRWRLQVAVWVLSTALSFAFAYRVSLILPSPVLVIAIWAMASFVVLVGFYVLVLCSCNGKDQGYYYCLFEAAGDGEEDGGLIEKKKNKSGAGGGELV